MLRSAPPILSASDITSVPGRLESDLPTPSITVVNCVPRVTASRLRVVYNADMAWAVIGSFLLVDV
jgi:hypothetical protein